MSLTLGGTGCVSPMLLLCAVISVGFAGVLGSTHQRSSPCTKLHLSTHASRSAQPSRCLFVCCLSVQVEDISLCEAVQQGLQEPSYGVGRYAPGPEAPMYHFHSQLYSSIVAGLSAG